MFRKIIVGHDLHSGGADALALARQLTEVTGAQLVVAGIFPIGALPIGFESTWIDEQARVAREIQAIADDAGAEADAFPSRSPALGLHGLADEIDADLIIVGSSRHSKVGQVLAGNVGRGLLHGAPCAVAIVPRGYAENVEELSSIVVGFDGSDEAQLALEDAVELAGAVRVPLKLVAVAAPPPIAYGKGADLGGRQELLQAIEEQMRAYLDDGANSVPEDVATESSLVVGEPAGALTEAAASGSLLVLGSRGYGPVRRVLLGSVSTEAIAAASSPVLIHPRGVGSEIPASRDRGASTAA